MIIARRSFLKGIGALFIAPAIIRAESLMPVKEYALPVPDWCPDGWLPLDGREIKKKFYPDLYRAYERMRLPMRVGNDQEFTTYANYEVPALYKYRARTIVSARDLKRPNGHIMKAGALYTLPPEALA